MLFRFVFAIIIGILVYAIMQWLLPTVPQVVDVLVGIVAAFIAYGSYPGIYTGMGGGRPNRPL